MKKIGIMGGTFNPIHNAHLVLAEEAYNQYGLDQVLFMPTKHPPHKSGQDLASDEHRKNMIVLAIKDNPHFRLSTLELERKGITYTAETLKILTSIEKDAEYYFIIGGDSLMSILSWKEPETIFSLTNLIAAGRDGIDTEEIQNQIEHLRETNQAKIFTLDVPELEISSNFIRNRIAGNETFRYYVPEEVYKYIQRHHLYM